MDNRKENENVKGRKKEPVSDGAGKVAALVEKLNRHRDEYYNKAAPGVSDAAYDRLYDELQKLEEKTGIILSGSPTQTAGYAPAGSLKKVRHPIPLLSLDKTKQAEELAQMAQRAKALLMLKLDGLTIKLIYENGNLAEASTRGDGNTGEDVTHNIPAFYNVPLQIPHKGRLVITGEGLIHQDDFERLKGKAPEKEEGKEGAEGTARNLAAGSIRLLDPSQCKERHVRFYAFNVLEGMGAFGEAADSREKLLRGLQGQGFTVCPFVPLSDEPDIREIEESIESLKELAERRKIPIDGMVLRYDSISYSGSLGRTGHHYKDGIAFKFEDGLHETVFRSIEWTPGRSGEIAPVALFDPVEIGGCLVSRASLHNLTFIKDLELHAGCRILVSKRNMIIPHIEENLDRGSYDGSLIPEKCPCCGKAARVYARAGNRGRLTETLHCDNPDCGKQTLKSFVHFAGKKAMDIAGISEATIGMFLEKGFLETFHDFYHLDRHKEEIVRMEGFGERSYRKMQESVERSRDTDFVRYVVAMDIPLIGRTAGRALDGYFHGNLQKFKEAARGRFDFTALPGFGETMGRSIKEWFRNKKNSELFDTLQKELRFREREENTMENTTNATENPFTGCTIVATGKLENFTREGINSKIISLGASAGSSVTRKTSYLICGEKPGSKLAKARELGIPVLTEDEFLSMIPA